MTSLGSQHAVERLGFGSQRRGTEAMLPTAPSSPRLSVRGTAPRNLVGTARCVELVTSRNRREDP